jgi:hypothetical protein
MTGSELDGNSVFHQIASPDKFITVSDLNPGVAS